MNKKKLTLIIIITVIVVISLLLFIHNKYFRVGWESVLRSAPDDVGEQFNPAKYTNFTLSNISNQSSGHLGR